MIHSIAELPFHRGETLQILHLDADRDGIDADYTGFGHSRVDEITLVGEDGRVDVVRDALVLALHCADPGEPLRDDIELEFVLDEISPGLSVSATLSRFLEVWLRVLSSDERAVVLALCNPHRAAVSRPTALLNVNTPLHYGVGDVESWYDGRVRLVSEAWRLAR